MLDFVNEFFLPIYNCRNPINSLINIISNWLIGLHLMKTKADFDLIRPFHQKIWFWFSPLQKIYIKKINTLRPQGLTRFPPLYH